MPVDMDNSSAKTVSNTASGEASVSSTGDQPSPLNPPPKKKRNQPGMPDPDAEVIALSPKTLMATNRFVCEICNKGFQRDQNLQLHRRGHNLPWKLRQRTSKEVKKKVYVCPEPSCVHHEPSRALGDLTGIKKHFCRKHGEKKWKCEKCSKKYAVQSDWKAHSKICGTREYKCECGTVFSRRDSFITHRAFCDALAEESAKAQPVVSPRPPSDQQSEKKKSKDDEAVAGASSPPPPPLTPQAASKAVVSSATMITPNQNPPVPKLPRIYTNLQESTSPPAIEKSSPSPVAAAPAAVVGFNSNNNKNNSTCSPRNSSHSSSSHNSSGACTTSSVFASLFTSSTASPTFQSQPPVFSNVIHSSINPPPPPPQLAPTDLASSSCSEPISLCLSTNHGSSMFPTSVHERPYLSPLQPPHSHSIAPAAPAMSATALLQKAAQMGATATGGSLLCALGLVSSSSSASTTCLGRHESSSWNGQRVVESENHPTSVPTYGLGLGVPSDEGSGLKELMMGSSNGFGPKHPTLDFLGLGMAAGGSTSNGLSALITSIGGGIDVASYRNGGEYSSQEMGSGRNS